MVLLLLIRAAGHPAARPAQAGRRLEQTKVLILIVVVLLGGSHLLGKALELFGRGP